MFGLRSRRLLLPVALAFAVAVALVSTIVMSQTSHANIVPGQYSLELNGSQSAGTVTVNVGIFWTNSGCPTAGPNCDPGQYQAVQWNIDYPQDVVTFTSQTTACPSGSNPGGPSDDGDRILAGCINFGGDLIAFSGNNFTLTFTCLAAGGEADFLLTNTTGGSPDTFVSKIAGNQPIHTHDLIVQCPTAAVPSSTNTLVPTSTRTTAPTSTNTPAPTSTNTPQPTSTRTPAPTSTNTPGPTSTNTPAPTSTNTPQPTSTRTPAPTSTNTPQPTTTNTPLPTSTRTPAPTSTNTPLPTSTNTPGPTSTNTTQPTTTNTPVPTSTNTPQPTSTNTAVPTSTNTPNATNTPAPTSTNTAVPTSTNTPNATNTPAPTSTNTAVPTSTNTPNATNTPAPTSTNTAVPTSTNTPNATNTVAATKTAQVTRTVTATATPQQGECLNIGQKLRLIAGILEHFGTRQGHGGYKARFDVNHDGRINFDDLKQVILTPFCFGPQPSTNS